MSWFFKIIHAALQHLSQKTHFQKKMMMMILEKQVENDEPWPLH